MDSKKKKPEGQEVGVSIAPNFGLWPRAEVQTSMRSREAWTEPKKNGAMVPQVSPVWKLQPPRRKEVGPVTQVVRGSPGGTIEPACSHQPAQRLDAEHLSARTDHEGQELQDQCRVRFGVCLSSGRLSMSQRACRSEPLAQPQPPRTSQRVSTSPSSSSSRRSVLECGHEFGNECRAAECGPRPGTSARATRSSSSGGPSRTSQGSTPSSRSTTRAV